MKTIKLDYDPDTGMVYDGNKTYIGCNLAIVECKDVASEVLTRSFNNVSDLVKLKTAGFTTEDIIDMHHKGLI